jgi:hypothetical protein
LLSWHVLQTANAEEPPPDGSTATTTWLTSSLRMPMTLLSLTATGCRAMNALTSFDENALLVASALTPMDSRSSMAAGNGRLVVGLGAVGSASDCSGTWVVREKALHDLEFL